MPEFFDYDPLTGIRTDFDYDEESGNVILQRSQDVSALLDYNKALANDGITDKGIKESWWLYAKIPPVVQVALHQKGIDISDPNSTKRIIQEINEHYAHLKCTQKNEAGIAPKIYLP